MVTLVLFGSVPTMVNFTVFLVSSVKPPFHWVRVAAGALGARSMWFRARLVHRFGVEDVGILGFLSGSEAGERQHKGHSNDTDSKRPAHILT